MFSRSIVGKSVFYLGLLGAVLTLLTPAAQAQYQNDQVEQYRQRQAQQQDAGERMEAEKERRARQMREYLNRMNSAPEQAADPLRRPTATSGVPDRRDPLAGKMTTGQDKHYRIAVPGFHCPQCGLRDSRNLSACPACQASAAYNQATSSPSGSSGRFRINRGMGKLVGLVVLGVLGFCGWLLRSIAGSE